MKKLIFFLLFLIITTTFFGQQTGTIPALTKQEYLQKSRRQKTSAFILLGGGFGTLITGVSVMGGKCHDNTGSFILMGAGFTSMIASVPVFISAGKNKKKAMSMSFKNQMVPQFQGTGFIYKPIPSLSLTIKI